MKAMGKGGKFQIDWVFYGIALGILLIITVTFWWAKRDVEIHEGKDVQKILEVSNLDSDEQWESQARNYVANKAKSRQMTSGQREKAIEIYTKAFRDHMKTWIDGRLNAESEQTTRSKQAQVWDKYNKEFEAMMGEN